MGIRVQINYRLKKSVEKGRDGSDDAASNKDKSSTNGKESSAGELTQTESTTVTEKTDLLPQSGRTKVSQIEEVIYPVLWHETVSRASERAFSHNDIIPIICIPFKKKCSHQQPSLGKN